MIKYKFLIGKKRTQILIILCFFLSLIKPKNFLWRVKWSYKYISSTGSDSDKNNYNCQFLNQFHNRTHFFNQIKKGLLLFCSFNYNASLKRACNLHLNNNTEQVNRPGLSPSIFMQYLHRGFIRYTIPQFWDFVKNMATGTF